MSDAAWYMGDFNADGTIDDKDAAILAANWHYGVSQASVSVPEPGTFVLLAGNMLALMTFRLATNG